eukprot:jgi/Botrbrau1/5275/Bobra.0172s0130.1
MVISHEPILDVVRGLSTIASFSIVFGQYLVLTKEIFTSTCEVCKGTGRVTCRHCGGTKTLRRRQGEWRPNRLALADRTRKDTYMCIHCGPPGPSDFRVIPDTDREAYNIMDNLKAAIAGKMVPNRYPCQAGCQPCPSCGNNPVINRHTPNFARLTLTEMPFNLKIDLRRGYMAPPGVPARRRRFHEFPTLPPYNEEMDGVAMGRRMVESAKAKLERKRRKKLRQKRDKGKSALDEEAKPNRRPDPPPGVEYIYPYVDDDDTDEDFE